MVTEWSAQRARYKEYYLLLHVGLLDTDIYFNSLTDEEKLEVNLLIEDQE